MNEKRTAVPREFYAVPIKQDPIPAMVSIRIQEFRDLYDTEEGFRYGTVFSALNKPFRAGGKLS